MSTLIYPVLGALAGAILAAAAIRLRPIPVKARSRRHVRG
jgi:hypothetical protein